MLVMGRNHEQKHLLWSAAALTTSIGLFLFVSSTESGRKLRKKVSHDVYFFIDSKSKRRLQKKVSFSSSVLEKEAAKEGADDGRPTIPPEEVMQLIRQRRSIFPKQYVDNAKVPRQVLDDMLEAASWAPSHHLTQPWHFVVFDTIDERVKLGHFLANHYRTSTEKNPIKAFSSKKYAKKIANAGKSSYVIAVCVKKTRNPQLEEICSVACAVQNMHLMATAHQVGAYWSSSVVFSGPSGKAPPEVMEFLGVDPSAYLCLGWMFVGPYGEEDSWPQGRRKPCSFTMHSESDISSDDNVDVPEAETSGQ
jgi:nitroreductase